MRRVCALSGSLGPQGKARKSKESNEKQGKARTSRQKQAKAMKSKEKQRKARKRRVCTLSGHARKSKEK